MSKRAYIVEELHLVNGAVRSVSNLGRLLARSDEDAAKDARSFWPGAKVIGVRFVPPVQP